MRSRRTRLVVGAVVVAGAAVIVVVSRTAQTPPDNAIVADAMRVYVEESRTVQAQTRQFGAVEEVTCKLFGDARYRGEAVFLCDERHQSGTTGVLCAVIRNNALYTSDRYRTMPCPRVRSGPAS